VLEHPSKEQIPTSRRRKEEQSEVKKVIVMAMLGMVVSVAIAQAADAPAVTAPAAATTVTGVVVVKSGADGAVTSVAIQAADGKTVAVVLDENGKKLAEMKGQKVMAVGEMVNGSLKVKTCKAVPAASATP
jgi:parvulin-like peptidyl-prolyl isomerase